MSSSPSAPAGSTLPVKAGAVAAVRRLVGRLEQADRLRTRPGLVDETSISLQRFARAVLLQRLSAVLASEFPTGDPPHIAVAGGTNTGKSTLLNVLLGAYACQASATARFTQHPLGLFSPHDQPGGFRDETLIPPAWGVMGLRFDAMRFAGPEPPPPSTDEELIAGQHQPSWASRPWPSDAAAVADHVVLWDLPDFSTQAAQFYFDSVLTGVALADIVVFVVTDESYADDRALRLIKLLAASGTRLVLTANKTDPENAELVRDMRELLRTTVGDSDATLHVLPRVAGTPQTRVTRLLTDDAGRRWRQAVRDALAGDIKLATARAGVHWIDRHLSDLLDPLREEAASAGQWSQQVEREALAAVERYDREYVRTNRNPEFKRALVELMDLMEVPGIGPVLKAVRNTLGLAFQGAVRVVKWAWQRYVQPTAPKQLTGEAQLIADLIAQWRVRLADWSRAQAQHDPTGPWVRLAGKLDDNATLALLQPGIDRELSEYRRQLDEQVHIRARTLFKLLREHPEWLNLLRGAQTVLQTVSIAAAIKLGGVNVHDLILVPLASGLSGLLVEAGLGQALQREEETLRTWQRQAFQQAWTRALVLAASELIELRATAADVREAEQAWAEARSAIVEKLARL